MNERNREVLARFFSQYYSLLREASLNPRLHGSTPTEDLEEQFHDACVKFMQSFLDRKAYFLGDEKSPSYGPERFLPDFRRMLARVHKAAEKNAQEWRERAAPYVEEPSHHLDESLEERLAPSHPDALAQLAELLTQKQLETLLALKEGARRAETLSATARAMGISFYAGKSRIRSLCSRLRRFRLRVEDALRYFIFSRSVFVSSTFEDLREHRAAVLHTLTRISNNENPLVIHAMEYFLAGPGHPGDRCLELVRRSDYYVGIFGARYGTIWRAKGISFTHAELSAAEQAKILCCIYMPTREHAAALPKETHREAQARADDLREYLLRSYVVEQFSSSVDLARLVAEQMAARV